MDAKYKYYYYLTDKRLGAKLSNISIGFGFMGFVLKEMLVNRMGVCVPGAQDGCPDTLSCYLVLIGPFVLGVLTGTFVVFRTLGGVARYNNEGCQPIDILDGSRDSDVRRQYKLSRRDRKIILYGGVLLTLVSLFSVWSTLHPEVYFDLSKNVFPIITLSILSVVYLELILSMFIGSLYRKLISHLNKEWRKG